MPINLEVRELWRITIQPIPEMSGLPSKPPFYWYIAGPHETPKSIMALTRNRFTSAWWETYTITNIEEIGKLHILDRKSLYELD